MVHVILLNGHLKNETRIHRWSVLGGFLFVCCFYARKLSEVRPNGRNWNGIHLTVLVRLLLFFAHLLFAHYPVKSFKGFLMATCKEIGQSANEARWGINPALVYIVYTEWTGIEMHSNNNGTLASASIFCCCFCFVFLTLRSIERRNINSKQR